MIVYFQLLLVSGIIAFHAVSPRGNLDRWAMPCLVAVVLTFVIPMFRKYGVVVPEEMKYVVDGGLWVFFFGAYGHIARASYLVKRDKKLMEEAILKALKDQEFKK